MSYHNEVNITIADMNWASADIQTAILSAILEDGYGYSVSLVTAGTLSGYTAMTEGSIDIAPELWTYAVTTNENVLYLGDGLDVAEGFYIDKYTADLYDIDSIDDMFNSNISELFIEDGNPTFHLPPESWDAHDPSIKLFYSMGLDAIYTLVPSSSYSEFCTVSTIGVMPSKRRRH